MKTVFVFFLLYLGLSSGLLHAQSSHQLLRQGDKAFKNEDYQLAEESYRKSVDKKVTSKGNFNLGNSVYEQERYEEAAQHFQTSINSMKDDLEKAEAYFNLGNAQLKQGNLEASIEAYKEAINLNPTDNDFKNNLYMAKLLRREEQQQEQEQQKQQQEDNNNQEEQNQDPQDQQSQQEQEQQKQAEEQNQSEQSPSPEEQKEMNKREADRYLNVVENKEKELQEKLKKKNAKAVKPKKDW